MALVSICVLPNHATFMTDTLDATFVTSILFVCSGVARAIDLVGPQLRMCKV